MEEDLRADAPGMDEDEARRLHAQPATAAAAGGGGGDKSRLRDPGVRQKYINRVHKAIANVRNRRT